MTSALTSCRPPSLADLTARQLAAIDAFHEARRAVERADGVAASSREMRMDVDRRTEVLRREHQALLQRAEVALRRTGDVLRSPALTALVAHRQEWWTRKVTDLLLAAGVRVLGATEVGADAVGWAVAEQPDLVLVEDRLAMIAGEQVVREVRQYCPHAVVGAQVAHSDGLAAMFAAGATTGHVRAVPPALVVEDVLAAVASRPVLVPAG